MKDSTDDHACGLEMKGGLNGIRYEQQFVRASKSQYPGKPPAHKGKEIPNSEAMRITLKC